jgi:integrase
MPDLNFKTDDGRRLQCRAGEERTEYVEVASGLRLRVTRTGARTWAVAYWSPLAKTTRRLKLGDAGTMPLSAARSAARAALHAVEREGRDPQAERVADRLQERQDRIRRAEDRRQANADRKLRATFGAVCREYVEHRRSTPSGKYNRRARSTTLAAWSGILGNYIAPAIGDRLPRDLTREEFIDVLEAAVKRGGPSMGPRTRELLSAVWRWMEQRPRQLRVELPAVSPLAGLPKVGIAQKERERALSPAELWRFWRAAEAEGLEGEALRLSLLTAARVREARDLPWSEVDLATATWRLPATRNKSGRDRLIPLSPPAVALLRRLQGRSGGALVFGRPDLLDESMARIRVAMKGEPWQARDLRRTAATLCGRLGADPFVVALVLGHARPDERMPAVTGGYLRWDYADKVREILDRLGAWVEETVARATEPGGDVVSIRAQR